MAGPLKDVEVRKAASGLTTLANEKQREQRDKLSGKKKSKAASKPALGGAKAATKYDIALAIRTDLTDPVIRLDTDIYDEALDDFGTRGDDFM